jgi:hypothetical protein
MATRRRSCPPVRLRSCRDTEGRWGRWGRWRRWGSCVALGLGGHPGAGPAAQPLRNNPHGRPRHRIAERQVPRRHNPSAISARPATPPDRGAPGATGGTTPSTITAAAITTHRSHSPGRPPHRNGNPRHQPRHNPSAITGRRDHHPPEPLPRPAIPPDRGARGATPRWHPRAQRRSDHRATTRPTVIGDRPSQSGLDSALMACRSRFVTHVPEIARPGALNNDDNGLSTRLTVGSAGSGRRCRGRCTRSRTWAAGSGSGSSAPGWSLGAGCGACRGTGARLRM